MYGGERIIHLNERARLRKQSGCLTEMRVLRPKPLMKGQSPYKLCNGPFQPLAYLCLFSGLDVLPGTRTDGGVDVAAGWSNPIRYRRVWLTSWRGD
jgi:hypothetical protein